MIQYSATELRIDGEKFTFAASGKRYDTNARLISIRLRVFSGEKECGEIRMRDGNPDHAMFFNASGTLGKYAPAELHGIARAIMRKRMGEK